MIRYILVVSVGIATLGLTACNTGLGLIETRISGKVIFLHREKRPAEVESVWVIAADTSIMDNPNLNDLVLSDRPVDLNKDTSEYEIFVPEGAYIVAAIWKEKGKDWNFLNLLGIYGFDPISREFFDSEPIFINKSHRVASGRNIVCDWESMFFHPPPGMQTRRTKGNL